MTQSTLPPELQERINNIINDARNSVGHPQPCTGCRPTRCRSTTSGGTTASTSCETTITGGTRDHAAAMRWPHCLNRWLPLVKLLRPQPTRPRTSTPPSTAKVLEKRTIEMKWYVYTYRNENNCVYYCGKGVGGRCYSPTDHPELPPKERIVLTYFDTERGSLGMRTRTHSVLGSQRT